MLHSPAKSGKKSNDIYADEEGLDFSGQEMTTLGIKERTAQHAGPRRLRAAAGWFDGDADG